MDSEEDDDETSPLVKVMKSHVQDYLREIPEPHDKDKNVNQVWNNFKKSIQMYRNELIKEQVANCQVMAGGAICISLKPLLPRAPSEMIASENLG